MKIGSSTASIPNPTPLLFLITATALLLWPDAVSMTALLVTAALVVPLSAYWLSASPGAAVIALIVASAIPRLYVEIAGMKARPEHIIGGIMCISILFLIKKRRQPVRWIWADYVLAAYIALNIFSSLFMSIAPAQTFKWAMQQLLVILGYFFLRVLAADRAGFRKAFAVMLAVGGVTTAYAILCFYSNRIFGTEFGVAVAQYGDIAAPHGLQFEANLLGSYCGALSVMMLVMYLYDRRFRFLLGFGVTLVGMAVSLSRGALGATLIAFLIVAVFSWRNGLLTKGAVFSLAKTALCALLVVLPAVLPHYTERFSTVDIADPTSDSSTLTRFVQVGAAIDEVLKHPILGGGTSSFQLAFDWQSMGEDWQDQGWIGNTELRVLHDTGLVGLSVFIGFFVSLVRKSWGVLKRESNPELVALLASAVVYFVSFQATEGTLLAFPWVHLGLIGCAVSGFYARNKAYQEGLAPTASG